MTIFYGDKNTFLPSHLNFGKYALDEISKFKDKVALIDAATKKKITYKELAQSFVNVAFYLEQRGLKKNDVVAICSENRIEYMITALAVFSTGATLTCMNGIYNKDEIIHALHISKPKYIFLSQNTNERYYESIKSLNMIKNFYVFDDVPTNSETISFKEILQSNIDISSFKFKEFKEFNGGIAVIMYSSGTTGPAKGVKLTHSNLIIATQQPVLSPKDHVILSIAPWSSSLGLIFTLHEVVCGRTSVFLPRFSENLFLEAIQTYKVGVLIVVPPVIIIMCKSITAKNYDLSSIEIVYSGGAPLNQALITELKSTFPNIKYILQGYGMTEATGAITGELVTKYKEGSVGTVLKGNIVKIVDVNTRKILGPRQAGEVCVKGPVLFDGYIEIDNKSILDEDGFYKTGDIAYYDEDGFFYIVDRIKEIIKYKGWQVSPSELEDLLLQHPAIKDVGVIGRPDDFTGELPTAFIVKKPNINVTETEITEYVAKKVSPWKRLHGGVIFVKEIPKNASGKILRRKLREMLPKLPTSKL
ncbi:luciferin 4-monooxygenase-like [Battus philenor]|uniref:luciferin 4-monooxygenase-like n=1 Tax=Battus philenor TaxID=42288 RepID=UPI0035CFEE3E